MVRPCGLVSLWDMLDRYAHDFAECLEKIELAEHQIARYIDTHYYGNAPLSDDLARFLTVIMRQIRRHCEALEMDGSIALADRLSELVDVEQRRGLPVNVLAAEILTRVTVLRETIRRELERRYFLFVSPENTKLYEQPELFGTTVHQNFAGASFHMNEAGSCRAVGRPTAAVFHLMCVLEVALDSLAAAVGLPFQQANWHKIIDDIGNLIRDIAMGKRPAPADWDKTWYADVATELSHFKEAWRNHTNHGRAKYTEGEATKIYDHVKAFMEKISTRLEQRI